MPHTSGHTVTNMNTGTQLLHKTPTNDTLIPKVGHGNIPSSGGYFIQIIIVNCGGCTFISPQVQIISFTVDSVVLLQIVLACNVMETVFVGVLHYNLRSFTGTNDGQKPAHSETVLRVLRGTDHNVLGACPVLCRVPSLSHVHVSGQNTSLPTLAGNVLHRVRIQPRSGGDQKSWHPFFFLFMVIFLFVAVFFPL